MAANSRSGRIAAAALAALLAGCGTSAEYSYSLMPAPLILQGEDGAATEARGVPAGIPYATMRPPSPDGGPPFYLDERGDVVRLGLGALKVEKPNLPPDEISRLVFSPERRDEIVISLEGVEEFGVLPASVTGFSSPESRTLPDGADAFAAAIDAELARSGSRELTVYVHGYKVPFADPLLAVTEFWMFMDWQGAAVAFAWPATPSALAYLSDSDTAALSAVYLRGFLKFLAERTKAERINVLAYSMGAELTMNALHQIALGPEKDAPPLGDVILTGGDIDRGLMAARLEDGVLDRVERLTVYLSDEDQALGLSRFLVSRPRLGQMWAEGEMPEDVEAHIASLDAFSFIDVSGAEGAYAGNGHGYYRASPWVSTDILAILLLDAGPEARGLVRGDGASWRFPDDYPERVKALAAGG